MKKLLISILLLNSLIFAQSLHPTVQFVVTFFEENFDLTDKQSFEISYEVHKKGLNIIEQIKLIKKVKNNPLLYAKLNVMVERYKKEGVDYLRNLEIPEEFISESDNY